ncbi:hypothetical protein L2E82_42894 [Cichorium intybus]|uniref:Uncharacterized protein n=1 Tax=Cichorium intybus TaxID=13427 RepID=A0ACB8ZN88_CICIN|nr:hypothetical protein L2E82_42894 [Cichorium intybus]
MAKTLSSFHMPPPAPPPMPPSMVDNPYPTEYWCYQCDKRVLRLIAQAVRDDDAPLLPPSDHAGDYIDHLRIELDEWDENDDEIAMDMMIKKMNMRSRRGR